MDLIILEQVPRGQYRGLNRLPIRYRQDLVDEHPVNQAFHWYMQEGGEDGVIHDLGRARSLVEAYRHIDPPLYYEIIEVTKSEPPQTTSNRLLGFDLAAGYYDSLLSDGLGASKFHKELMATGSFMAIQPLLRLIEEFFQPRLNSNRLFGDRATACFCLECMMALQKVRPGLYEDESVIYEVLGVWEVLWDIAEGEDMRILPA